LSTASTKNIVVPDMFEAFLSQVLRMHNQVVKYSSWVCYNIKSKWQGCWTWVLVS